MKKGEMSMARGSQKTDKVKKQNIDLWPLTRFLVGTTSLIIGVVFIFTTARTIVGREITLIEITQVPASFIRGMFSSWPRFVVGFLARSKIGQIRRIGNEKV